MDSKPVKYIGELSFYILPLGLLQKITYLNINSELVLNYYLFRDNQRKKEINVDFGGKRTTNDDRWLAENKALNRDVGSFLESVHHITYWIYFTFINSFRPRR